MQLQYGLSAEQMATFLPGVTIEPYANQQIIVPATQILNPLIHHGERYSVLALERHCDMLCPFRTRDLLLAFDLRHSDIVRALRPCGLALETLRNAQSGTTILQLKQLQTLVHAAEMVEHGMLSLNWNLETSNLLISQGCSALARA